MGKISQRHPQLFLLPCPYQGHISPMLQLGNILQSKGFVITVVHTEFNSPNPSSHPNFNFLPIPDGLSDHEISSGDVLGIITMLNVNCRSHLQECLSRMMRERKGPEDDIACIIYDELMYFSEAVANLLKIPSIILRTTSAATCLARTFLGQFKAEDGVPFKDSVSEDLVPEFHPLRFKDLPFPRSTNFDKYLQLTVDVYNIRTSSTVIWNTLECLEPSSLDQIQRQCQVPLLPIGPLHKFVPASDCSLLEEDNSCIAWLEKQKKSSVLYVSLGSVATVDEKELAELAWGLANSQQPFLWVVRPGSICGSEWTEALPKGLKESIGERGCIVKWAPQKKVLAHDAVGGFLSHCGWNSTLESISEGIPMICRPCFGDQRVTARYVSHEWKAGLQLENELKRGEIERAVRRLMAEKEGEVMRERAENLKEKFEISIKEGGSSYNSLNRLVQMIISF